MQVIVLQMLDRGLVFAGLLGLFEDFLLHLGGLLFKFLDPVLLGFTILFEFLAGLVQQGLTLVLFGNLGFEVGLIPLFGRLARLQQLVEGHVLLAQLVAFLAELLFELENGLLLNVGGVFGAGKVNFEIFLARKPRLGFFQAGDGFFERFFQVAHPIDLLAQHLSGGDQFSNDRAINFGDFGIEIG